MAPNKKKKKAASNPARGFATVSTASKTKEQDINEAQLEDQCDAPGKVVRSGPNEDGVLVSGGSVTVKSETTLQDLSPEELESQLEDSRLQLLVDTYRDKIKKDVSRQASRMRTERRVLRPQAEHLSTRHWLPLEIMQPITDLIEMQQKLGSGPQTASEAKDRGLSLTEDDLMVKMWTLKRLLPELGFSNGSTQLALRHLLSERKIRDSNSVSISRDSMWGLDECLDWLALTSAPGELPSFLSEDARKAQQRPQEGSRFGFTELDIPVNAPTISAPSTPLGKRTPSQQSPLSEGSPASSESDSDSDFEPNQQLAKYLTLQSRLYDISPHLVDPSRKKSRTATLKKRSPHANHEFEEDPKVTRLTAKLHRITSDILFDKEAANSRWAETWDRLAKEKAERKRLGIRNDSEPIVGGNELDGNGNERDHHAPEKPSLESINASEPTENGPDSSDLIGELFYGLPEYVTDAATGASIMRTTDSAGTTITIRDFGRWIGVSPRKILEEACRARDPSCRINYKLISVTTFSNRHSFEIRWSRAQHPLPITLSLLKSMTCVANQNSAKAEMAFIACPDATQSEAYISTVALFLIFASSPKEEKAYLRLPAVWRDLWTELSIMKKEQDDTQDRDVLRELRSWVEEYRDQTEGDLTPPKDPKAIQQQPSEPRVSEASGLPPTVLSEGIRSLWERKSSTASYQHMLTSRINLPIWQLKNKLLGAIEKHQVVVICGETGCGKSTQVPAFVLEHELSSGRPCRVYCTEPRRISAISLARRVSEELGESKYDVGTSRSLVGYAIRLESQVTTETRLVYATTGIVMRMLERSDDLADLTHLILDEVHERSIDSDFLLVVLRKLLLRRADLKVVLMSATVNAEKFSKYLDDAPIINVPGRTFPVKTRYLEDAIELTRFNASVRYGDEGEVEDDDDIFVDGSAKTSLSADNLKGYTTDTCNTMLKFDEHQINYDLILKLLETVATIDECANYSNAVLVFLPGIAEIKRLNDMLVGHRLFSHGWYIYALHSTVATEEQERAFLIPPPGHRKIILATNIAETGITIPDVTCVIDTGKHREMRFDERRQLSRLVEVFISRANAKQRRGRAGRVQKGLCFHLFSKNRHDNMMLEEQTPEMLRLSLQDLVLRVKICKVGSIEQTLSEALDPPSAKNIRRAIDALIDVKALTPFEDLTSLGRQLAKLPLDVFLGKLVLLGSIFGCLDAMLTIAAILSSKLPFSAPMGARSQADAARLAFKKGDSDLLTVYNAYCAWRRACGAHVMSEYQFCRTNFLSPQSLSNIEDLKAQLTTHLVDAGFMKLDDSEKAALTRVRFYSRKRNFVEIPQRYNSNNNNDQILNATIACSFYPKLLKREGKGWRNVTNNQSVSLHPTSVNKGTTSPSKWLSFYHMMQSSNKFYNAHETSTVDDIVIALMCGEAEFKMFAGVMIIDGHRVRFSVDDWKVMLAIKTVRTQVRQIMAQSSRHPGQTLYPDQQAWLDIWQRIISPESSD
ncbi:hypothetical protein N7G274_007633 [Stereocaulon virgatum]|uniref:ATP dependent RNA helicase n=1 Tax=Stereocaulon virgatum TaxID=373712 RepID=A0ABR4A2P5_9LECA